MSRRGNNWILFSSGVYAHVEDYTVPQYGDWPDDEVEIYTPEDCIRQIEKYCRRFGKNQRGRTEQLRDLLKIAHYASLCHEKLEKKNEGE